METWSHDLWFQWLLAQCWRSVLGSGGAQTGPVTAPTWGRSSEREGHGAPVELRSALFMALWHLLLWAAPPEETELWKFKGILHGIGSIKATHVAGTGDHYRTLEAIKQLDRVINDSSQGPADPAQ